ncbi:MAG TPA: hypothetical protein VD793_06310 [Gemmatimonadales bacterium]|nr:hypothetical protein [Gemmatimonadales bacterium]
MKGVAGLVCWGVLWPVTAAAQAPSSAELWRLAAATLAGPAGLETGVTAAFWNPAAPDLLPRLAAGVEITQTPDVVGVVGLIAAVQYRLHPALALTVQAARADIDDIVRTTTSATSDLGTVPIYEQAAGVGVIARAGRAQAGVLLRGHDARFDAERESGLTLDAGFRMTPLERLTLAAATHFFPADLTTRDLTDYFAGADWRLLRHQLLGHGGGVMVRYGVAHRERTGLEHTLGWRLAWDGGLSADVALGRERGEVEAAWRPAVGLGLRVGRYLIRAGRGSGINGVGASYRISLQSDILQ